MPPKVAEVLLGVDDHRAELEHAELAAVPADAGLAEERRAAVGAHGDGQAEHQRPDQQEEQRRGDPVDRALEQLRGAAEGGVGQAQQREPVDVRDVQARAGDLHQPGVDDQLDAAALEVPRELLEPHRRPAGRLPDGDGVVAAAPREGGDGVEVADDGNVGNRRAGAPRGADAGDQPAVVRSPPGAIDERRHRVLGAHGENPRHGPASTTQLVQPLAEDHAPGDRQDAGDRQHAEHPRSGLRQVQGEPDQRDDDCGSEEAVQQAAELERALPEHGPVPPTRQPECDGGQHEDDAAGDRHSRG